jgi:undecaprenyl-diphosphatase
MRVTGIDHLLRAWIVAHRLKSVTALMVGLSVVGRGGLVWLAIAGVLTILRRMNPRAVVVLVLALILASILADHVLKPLIARERPFVTFPQVAVIGGRPDDASFPSGHAANAFAGAFVLSRFVAGGQIVWWALASAIAYSRVYLGVHYPLDVVGGALLGLASAALISILAARVARRCPTPRAERPSID